MARLGEVASAKGAGLADFLFTVTKTRNGITLKGLQGVAWTELSFSLAQDKKQAINQVGMTQ